MNLDPTKLVERLKTFVPDFIKFLEYDVLKPSRRGEAKDTADKIKEHLIKYKNCTMLSSDIEFATLIFCVALKLKQNLQKLFIHFDVSPSSYLMLILTLVHCLLFTSFIHNAQETTSYDEVQASTKLPKDGSLIVAVLGMILYFSLNVKQGTQNLIKFEFFF